MNGLLDEYRKYVQFRAAAQVCRQWILAHMQGDAIFETHMPWGSTRERVGHSQSSQTDSPASLDYILCTPTTRPDFIAHRTGSWLMLLATPAFEFWERDRWSPSEKPLRFGFAPREQQELSHTARQIMHEFVASGNRPALPESLARARYQDRCDVDLALWVGGHEHGSQIGVGQSFAENFLDAACRVTRDSRFAPATVEDIARASIEITLLFDLAFPVSLEEATRTTIPHDRGHAVFSRNVRRGIYIPMLFNSYHQFKSYPELLHSLASSKAQLPKEEVANATFVTFPTSNWIANPSDHVTPLQGTIPAATDTVQLESTLSEAAHWLCAITEPNGFLPSILSPLYTNPKRSDLIRIILSALALNAYGVWAGNTDAIQTAGRIADYVRIEVGTTDTYPHTLVAYYLGQYYVATGRLDEAAHILTRYKNTPDTFSVLHRARLQCSVQHTRGSVSTCGPIVDDLVKSFADARRTGDASLATWAELITLTYDHAHPAHQEICTWFTNLQREDGSFPNTPHDPFTYVRGTSKVAEALAYTGTYEDAVRRALSWSARLQYRGDTMYHIPPQLQSRFLGAFRHDALNRDAWTDAAAHVLLAGARLLA